MKLKTIIYLCFLMFIFSCSNDKASIIKKNKQVYKKIKINIFEDANNNNLKDPLIYSKDEVLKILDNPILIKTTDNIEIWQYKGESCILNFIWDNNINVYSAIKIISYDLTTQNMDYKICYKNIIKELNIIY